LSLILALIVLVVGWRRCAKPRDAERIGKSRHSLVVPRQQSGAALPSLLLILLVSGTLMAFNTLLLQGSFPRVIPDALTLTRPGAIAALLVTVGIVLTVHDTPLPRRLVALVVALFGLYHLGAAGVVAWRGDEATDDILPMLTSLLLLLSARCLTEEVGSRRFRRQWRVLGGLCLMAGLLSLSAHFLPGVVRAPVWRITQEMRPVGGAALVVYGGATSLVAGLRGEAFREVPSLARTVGIVGCLLSVFAWMASSLLFERAQRGDVDALLSQLGDGISQWQVRLRDDWSTAAPARLDLARMPGVVALGGVDDHGGISWLRWARDVDERRQHRAVLAPAVSLQSIRGETHPGLHWHLVGPDDAALALVVFPSDDASGIRLAMLIDLAAVVSHLVDQLDIGLALTVWVADQEVAAFGRGGASDGMASSMKRAVRIQLIDGPALTLKGRPMSPGFGTPERLLPLILGGLGLFVSYQLMIWIALAGLRQRHAQALAVREQRYRSLFDHSPSAILTLSPSGTVVDINATMLARLGGRRRGYLGRHYTSVVMCLLRADVPDELAPAIRGALAGKTHSLSIRSGAGTAALLCFEVILEPVFIDDRVTGVFAIFRDVTSREFAQSQLKLMERSLAECSNGVVIVHMAPDDRPIVFVNEAFCRITGYDRDDVIGQPLSVIAAQQAVGEEPRWLCEALHSGEARAVTMAATRKDGSSFWCQIVLSPVHNHGQAVSHFVGIMDDITERKLQEQQLAHQATHDALTGLPNRLLLSDRLAHDFALAKRRGGSLAVLFIDLDEFKPINDTLGHEVGDRLLVSVTRRLSVGLRASDTLARIGGDEFVLLLVDIGGEEKAKAVAQRLLSALVAPHWIDDRRLHVTASIGIALLEGSAVEDPERLIQRADLAMYQAKQRGHNTYHCFTEDLDSQVHRRVTLRNALQVALDQQRLELFYQPLVDRDGSVNGAEALLRWQHPELGWISPADFIPLAEQTGQIVELGRWVLRRACHDTRRLVKQGLMPGRVAVNLSPMQFHRTDFVSSLMMTLQEVRLSPRWLELELTEGVLLSDTSGVVATLSTLARLGVSTAIDDFGTGFSSLDYLKTLPVQKIKIDRAFVEDVTSSDRDAAVCRSVVALARELDLVVLAEGVETQAQYDYLRQLGCEAFQGFFFAAPMPFGDYWRYLHQARMARG